MRIGKSIKSITDAIEAHQTEYSKGIIGFNNVFELMDDCGRVYRLAGDFERRCFNQAIFKEILVHDDLTLDAEYAEPFDIILNPNVFLLKNTFEKSNEQSLPTAQVTLWNVLGALKTKKAQTITNFFSDGLSKDIVVRVSRLYSKNLETAAAHCSANKLSISDENSIVKPEIKNPYGDDVKMVRKIIKKQKYLTDAEKDEVVSKYQSGMSMTKIADLYGCHQTTVGALLRKRGVAV